MSRALRQKLTCLILAPSFWPLKIPGISLGSFRPCSLASVTPDSEALAAISFHTRGQAACAWSESFKLAKALVDERDGRLLITVIEDNNEVVVKVWLPESLARIPKSTRERAKTFNRGLRLKPLLLVEDDRNLHMYFSIELNGPKNSCG
jgi:hypothetical protein